MNKLSERLLKQWRKEALLLRETSVKGSQEDMFAQRIIIMTQQLLDQYLMDKSSFRPLNGRILK